MHIAHTAAQEWTVIKMIDPFTLHHKILSACEHLMAARRIIEIMTEEERKTAVSYLERLRADMEKSSESEVSK